MTDAFTARAGVWLSAARPRTLVASVAPVSIGTCLAWRDAGEVSPVVVGLCFAFGILCQIGSNFANDYYDHLKGADAKRVLGPARAVASGVVSPLVMRRATYGVLGVAFFVGLALMRTCGAGWPFLLVGVSCVTCAVAYTAGPRPIAYVGLGDICVVLFFGLVATGGTHYSLVLAAGKEWTPSPWAGVCIGLMANNLLLVNNHRDAEEDAACGKRTTVVLFGRGFGVWAYLLGSAVALSAGAWADAGVRYVVCLAPASLWLGFKLSKANDRRDYGRLLGGSAAMVAAFACLTVAGLLTG